ncbi:ABC transporter substrate-binding protein [Streptomyces beihaiensis]|uniref:ABC transporter substrate-binding protein n=1 Tax=Streptomyces beihaiensis TaxID=2984495 RepID=A0ABT3TXR3_9ACTN|nr:ABC transporter substrate-binding protein [Streptomyces beihaiensis]MCX3061839.1 ABC transporter substrate-binding protein [Streptomyces beihaiensis]
MTHPFEIDHQGLAPTPAPEVPAARRGGRVVLLADAPPEHVDPAQMYIGTTLGVATGLFHRTLTGYIESHDGGPRRLVGDLATDTGRSTDGGRTWTYTLREGLRFEDGTPITSHDVAHAIARSFGPNGVYGPQFVQQALDPERGYRGPEQDGPYAPGVSTPDDRTLVFELSEATPGFPFFATTTTTTPVPRDRDTGADYETSWLSTGPYRVRESRPGRHILLERNPHWDPATDPIRHQYPDEVLWEFGVARDRQTERLLVPVGRDRCAVATFDVSEERVAEVEADPGLLARVVSGPSAYLQYVYVNTRRVTDVDVRRALNYAFDKGTCVRLAGGSAGAERAGTILAPMVPGHRAEDVYPSGEHGDPLKAKELLAGKELRPLVFAYPDTVPNAPVAPAVKAALEAAGFEIELRPVDKASFYSLMGEADNDCDLIYGVWGPDFPDASGVFDVLFRGDRLTRSGNMNLSYFDDPEITAEIAALAQEPDRTAAARRYADLDRRLMAEHAPVVPVYYKRQFTLYGPGVGGLFLSAQYFVPNLTRMYVTA